MSGLLYSTVLLCLDLRLWVGGARRFSIRTRTPWLARRSYSHTPYLYDKPSCSFSGQRAENLLAPRARHGAVTAAAPAPTLRCSALRATTLAHPRLWCARRCGAAVRPVSGRLRQQHRPGCRLVAGRWVRNGRHEGVTRRSAGPPGCMPACLLADRQLATVQPAASRNQRWTASGWRF